MTALQSIAPEATADPRQRIISAARSYFFAHGFRNVTMDDLAAALGMSKKTLYACFKSKSELVRAAILDKIARAQEMFQTLDRERTGDFHHDLHQLLACITQIPDEIEPPFIRDLQRHLPQLFTLVQTRRRQMLHSHFKRLLDQGRRAGTVRADISTKVIIEILLGATEAIANPTKLIELGLSPRAAYTAILGVVLDGVLVKDKGHKS